MVCRAQQQNLFAKAAAAGVSIPALLAAHPAFALVDERLATEGTGKIFGINDSAIFWNMLVSGLGYIRHTHQLGVTGCSTAARDGAGWLSAAVSPPFFSSRPPTCRQFSAPSGLCTMSARRISAAMTATSPFEQMQSRQ